MARRKKSAFPNLQLDPDTARGIFTVVILTIAGLLFLSVFDLAGSLGIAIDEAMANAFGWDRIFLPFFLLAIGIHDLTPERFPLKITNYIGFVLFYVAMNPFVHTAAIIEAVPTLDQLHKLGGKLGMLLSDPFVATLGRPGAGVVFFALLIVSMLLIFNTTLRRVFDVFTSVISFVKTALLFCLTPIRWFLARRASMNEARVRADIVQESVVPIVTKSANTLPATESSDEDEADIESADVSDEFEEDVALSPPKPKKRQPRVDIPLELLVRRDQKPTSGDIVRNQHVIQRTLETFGIPVDMGDVSVGPTVTQFTLKPSEGVKLSRITALHNDLALALAAHPIRIEAPIPGKSLVGLEVPNQSVATVGLREFFESKDWRERRQILPFALGRDVSGKPWITDLARMPHLLVAGATGSGKSVCLNTLIMSLMFSAGPDELKFVMVDPKRVELQVYNGIPHLVTPVITEVDKTVNALKWCMREMDRRFDVLSKMAVRDIATYNAKVEEKLPFIVFIIDELADLMVTALQEVEGPIVRLAQMARAVGIHLVVATQRPSTDVITGLIKANIPARIAFAVASSIDSRTILDEMGAEKLIGRGDMLIKTAEMATPKRLQGTFVSDEEIQRSVEYLKSKYDPAEYDSSIVERQQGSGTNFSNAIDAGDVDPLLEDAKQEIIRAGKASASLLQRRMKVGYARAARIIDLLEQEGFVGPADGAKPRELLNITRSKGLDQTPVPSHPALDQVNRELPVIEEEENEQM